MKTQATITSKTRRRNLCEKLILTIFLCVAIFNLTIYAQKAELVVQTGHAGAIRSMKFSPDGKLLASVGNDNTVRVWNVQTGQELQNFSGHNASITAVEFSSDGKLLATVSHSEGVIKLWNIETARELWSSEFQSKDKYRFTSDGQQRHKISFSPDGKYLAIGKSSDSNFNYNVSPPPPPPTPKPKGEESLEDYKKRLAEDEAEYNKSLKTKTLLANAIQIWNVAEGKKVNELLGHN